MTPQTSTSAQARYFGLASGPPRIVSLMQTRRRRSRPANRVRTRDIARPVVSWTDQEGAVWYYDSYEGNRACRWIEAFCRHRKGEWAGRAFRLAPWQRRLVRELFGWFGADGFRKHREAWIEIPRKNGKSTLMSAIALYMLVGDNEPAAEVYSVAGSEKQALLVYADAVSMVEGHPSLSKLIETNKKGMYYGQGDGKFAALGKGHQHGLNAHGIVGDEVHEWKGRDQYACRSTATGTRRQPLALYITTAGYEIVSLCGELHRTAVQVRAGALYRPELMVAIFAADPADDWQDEAIWHKANPGLRHGAPKIEYMRQKARQASQSPAEENSFKRLHLNIWTDSRDGMDQGGRLDGLPPNH